MRFAVALAVIALTAAPAHAVDKLKARELYRLGTQHYNLAEYDKALVAFKEAYRNFEDPIFLFNSAQCERQLSHKEEAIRLYRSYLRNAPDAPNKTEVSDIIARLESAIAAEKDASRARAAAATPPPPAPAVAPGAATASAPAALTVASPAPTPSGRRPIHKRWWFWTAIGAVAAGAAVGVTVGLTQRTPSAPTTSTELGSYRF